MGLFCLLGIFWLSIAPLFSTSSCGLLLPHDHLLLGGASEADLYAHLLAEAACASGHAQAGALAMLQPHAGAGRIISISHAEPETMPLLNILGAGQLVMLLPALAIGGLLLWLVWRLSLSIPVARSRLFPPGDPPPESPLPAACFAAR